MRSGRGASVDVDFERLAALVCERLAGALPAGMAVAPIGDGEYEQLVLRRWRVAHGGPPVLRERGIIVVAFSSHSGRRIIQVGPYDPEGPADLDPDRVGEMMSDVADEACEHTADRYEGDAAIEGDRLRIWFGLVPTGSGDALRWRDVLPELEPIPLDAITAG